MTAKPIKTSIRIPLALACVAAVIGVGGAARAQPACPVDLAIVDRDTGQVLKTWRHDGHLYVAGQPGDRYSLRVTNHTDGRVMVVISVDGVNIYTGQTASARQDGYIYSPHQSFDLTGWRKSLSEVAAFTFAPQSQSYASRTGRPLDVGVIGMAVFKEKAPPPPPAPQADGNRYDRDAERDMAQLSPQRRAIPSPASSDTPPPPPPPPPEMSSGSSAVSELVVSAQHRSQASQHVPVAVTVFTSKEREVVGIKSVEELSGGVPAQQRTEKLGTGYGAREESVIQLVAFEKATDYPQFVRTIDYDTYANLVADGVIPSDSGRHPRPFPADGGGQHFVPDPPDEPQG